MPYQDGSGPMGSGPMTGQGMGPCARGMSRGRGFFGRRQISVDDLEYEKRMLQADLKEIEGEIKNLKSSK